jgi:hypothetical protein
VTPIDFRALAQPFPADEIEWRVGQKSKDGKKATVLAYLTSRAVQNRLDEVVGPARWRDSYTPVMEGAKTIGYLCTLELEVGEGRWVGKTDVSDLTDIEALKGGISGALKRAAVKWGIGRYLYGLEARYLPIQEGYGPDGAVYVPLGDKGPGHIVPPKLPEWALPPKAKAEEAPKPEPAEEPKKASRAKAKEQPKPEPERKVDPVDIDDRAQVLQAVVGELEKAGWNRATVKTDIVDLAKFMGLASDPWAVATERLPGLPAWLEKSEPWVARWRAWWKAIDEMLRGVGRNRDDLVAFCASVQRPDPRGTAEDERNKLLAFLRDAGGLDRLIQHASKSTKGKAA